MKKIITVLFFTLTSILFSSCLMLTPYMPSARIIPDDAISLSAGAGRFSFTAETPTYVYDEYYYSYVSYTSKNEKSLVFIDIGGALKITGTNAEFGLSTHSLSDLTFNFKFGLTDPKDSIVQAALDACLHTSPLTSGGLGGSAGLIINIPVIFELPLDIVGAAYYQVHTRGTYSYTNYFQPYNSMYYYAGIEFPLRKDAIFIGGVGYTKPFDTANDANPLYFSLGIKTVIRNISGKTFPEPQAAQHMSTRDNPGMLPHEYAGEASVLMSEENYSEASALLAEGLKSYPSDSQLKKMLADCLYSSGAKKQALNLYSEALEAEPWNKALKLTIKQLRDEI